MFVQAGEPDSQSDTFEEPLEVVESTVRDGAKTNIFLSYLSKKKRYRSQTGRYRDTEACQGWGRSHGKTTSWTSGVYGRDTANRKEGERIVNMPNDLPTVNDLHNWLALAAAALGEASAYDDRAEAAWFSKVIDPT